MNQAIEDFFTSEINQTISSTINEKVLTNQYTDTGARVMNLWIKDGLLDDDRSASQTRHKFSMVEAVWVSVIEELRDIGLEKEKIKKVKTKHPLAFAFRADALNAFPWLWPCPF